MIAFPNTSIRTQDNMIGFCSLEHMETLLYSQRFYAKFQFCAYVKCTTGAWYMNHYQDLDVVINQLIQVWMFHSQTTDPVLQNSPLCSTDEKVNQVLNDMWASKLLQNFHVHFWLNYFFFKRIVISLKDCESKYLHPYKVWFHSLHSVRLVLWLSASLYPSGSQSSPLMSWRSRQIDLNENHSTPKRVLISGERCLPFTQNHLECNFRCMLYKTPCTLNLEMS